MYPVIVLTLENIITPALIGSGIALGLGIIITIASKIFAVPVDEKLEAVTNILPGVNCGACGYSGCEAYAQAICSGETDDIAKCPVGGMDTVQELAEYLGRETPDFIPKVAHVFCHGTTEFTQKRYDYSGTISCAAAHGLFSGPNSCTYGCIGFGDCEAVCPYQAIYMAEGIAHVDSTRCTACGLCVEACPKNLIEIIPKHLDAYTVKCRNKWPGAQTRKNCKVGCIGCRRCYKVCEYDAIHMDGPLAVIDQEKCTHCGDCIKVCPTNAIWNGLMLGLDENGKPGHTGQIKAAEPAVKSGGNK